MSLNWKRIILILIILILVGMPARYREEFLLGIGKWLVIETPLRHADLVIALGGDRDRQTEAVSLLKGGMAQRILFVGLDVTPDDYVSFEIPPDMIISPPLPAYSTRDEAVAVLKITREKGVGSILLVTYPYHFRRASLVFDRVLKGTGAVVILAPAPIKTFSMEKWWGSRDGWLAIFIEYVGLLYYWAFL